MSGNFSGARSGVGAGGPEDEGELGTVLIESFHSRGQVEAGVGMRPRDSCILISRPRAIGFRHSSREFATIRGSIELQHPCSRSAWAYCESFLTQRRKGTKAQRTRIPN